MKRLIVSILLVTGSAHAQDLGAFEKVLFPVLSAAPIRGANNTLFQTRLMASARQPVGFYPATASDGGLSFGIQPAGIDFVRFFEASSRSAGRLLYFDRSKADEIRFFFELAITGPDNSIHQTTLPVVRERNFQRGPSIILGVTTGPKYDFSGGVPPKVIGFKTRNHVRIYDVDNTGTLSAIVRVTVPALEAFGAFATFDVRVDARDSEGPSYPSYAVVSLPDLCITAPTGITCRDYPLTVSIEPGDPTARYYAFASATDNSSGETAVFFAQ